MLHAWEALAAQIDASDCVALASVTHPSPLRAYAACMRIMSGEGSAPRFALEGSALCLARQPTRGARRSA